MVVIYDENTGKEKIDHRHVVETIGSITWSAAVVVNEDGTFERVYYMDDDMRTWKNYAVEDATAEELERYRKYRGNFVKGDVVEIVDGRKMRGEIKTVQSIFDIDVGYGKVIHYLGFTDGSKVQARYCKIL